MKNLFLTAILLVAGMAGASAGVGVTLTPLFSFGYNYTNTDGTSPTAGLVQGTDAALYGTTPAGGTNDLGTVFKITTNGVYTRLISFDGANGSDPAGSLVQNSDGNFYGTTYSGGAFDLGTVFKLTPGGAVTTLLSFNGTNGANPAACLALATNGVLYGTTENGGTHDLDSGGDGTIFKITTNGVFASIYSFANGDDGGNTDAGLAWSKNGVFYGTTPYGGADGSGSVFQVTTNGGFTTLYSFTGGKDGSTPDAAVVQGKDGNFYGTTAYGGKYDVDNGGDGTVFKVTSAGVLTSLLSFDNTNGSDPEAGLAQGTDGELYGTTESGGVNGDGTAFKITTSGVFSPLISFAGVNGAYPQAGLVQAANGNFYGTTPQNGPGSNLLGYGTIFDLATNGNLGTLYTFGDNNPNGAVPAAGLVPGLDGNFYGATTYGGTNHGSFGSIFRVATNGLHTVLASFNGTNGAYPEAALTRGADGNFYGTTAYGGTNGLASGGYGTVFKFSTNGTLTALASFNGTNGANPLAGLVQGLDGSFYGTTENGGTNNVANGGNGTIFKITTNGVLTQLVSFQGTNGASPLAGLTLGPDGKFYGTTAAGGTNHVANGGDGTIFRVTTNGALTRLFCFNVTNGAGPAASLVLGTNGLFYGTTQFGGTNDTDSGGDGTLFEITTNGHHTTLYSFANGADGANPTAALLLGYDNNFYGTTSTGGTNYDGVAFQLTPEGFFTVLYTFTGGSDGANPVGSLAEDTTNYFYGAAQAAGTNGAGTLFQIFVDPFPFIVTSPADFTNFTGASATFTVAAIGSAPLSYQWQRSSTNLTDHGNISGSATRFLTLTNLALADAAGYSVVVSNAYGAVTSTVAHLTVILPFPPTVTTEAAAPVGINSATLNALATPDGAATTVWFAWGFTTNYGHVSAVTNIGSGGDAVSVSLDITNLLPLTLYHFVAVAGNALGTNTDVDLTFLTPGALTNISFTPLLSFDGTNGGAAPPSGLVQDTNGNFYGTTYSGGDYGDGTVFKLSANGGLTNLLSFNGTNGANPQAGLVWGADGQLYGTTYSGGTNDLDSGGDGTVFKITTNGVFTSLVSFNVTNGANPAAALAPGAGGYLYGTTENGGTNDVANGGDGTVFKITTNGVLTSLFSFDNTNGANSDAELLLASDGVLYGTTSSGGADGSGTVFQITTNGTLTTLYSFTGDADGDDPKAGLVQGPDGDLYGTTYDGGNFGAGTVFQMTTNGLLTTLYAFTGGTDGANPQTALTLGADGNFYGTTSGGGAANYGTVFVLTPDGALATLVAFDSDQYGATPQAALTLGSNGTFYGTAQAGGDNDAGTLFQFSVDPFPYIFDQPADFTNFTGASATFTVAAIGAVPLHYQWQRRSTNLTDHGNISGSATRFLTLTNLALADATGYSVIVSNASGAVTSTVAHLTVILPFPPAVTTEAAASVGINSATLNALATPDGAATTVWFAWGFTTNYGNATAVTNIGSGGIPVSVSLDLTNLLPLTLYHFVAVAGNALGTNTDVDFSFVTPGALPNVSFTPLLSFDGTNGGDDPQSGLVQDLNGNFYGTTYSGGDYGDGTVFKLTANGVLTNLFSFNGTNGANPQAGLVWGADGQLYGTTYSGGANNLDSGGDGTVFKITTNGVFTSLVSFNVTDGANPAAALAPGTNDNLYGTTENGGTNDVANGGDGTVFKITTNGVLTSLFSFDNTNGANPDAELVQATVGCFFGTTYSGGANDLASGGDGTVFKITTNGVFTSLVSFNVTNGANPHAALALGANGCLYGTTETGGTNDLASGGEGTSFAITTNGLLTSLYSFTGGTNGANPEAALTLGTDGNFYGTTSSGGENGNGTVFVMTPGGALTTLVLFDSDLYGANPESALTLGANGSFYGTANDGGANGSGTVFSFSILPASPVFEPPTLTDRTLTLTWSAVIGQRYQLQYATNLSATNWLNLSNLTASKATATATDTMNASGQRFYRVVRVSSP